MTKLYGQLTLSGFDVTLAREYVLEIDRSHSEPNFGEWQINYGGEFVVVSATDITLVSTMI